MDWLAGVDEQSLLLSVNRRLASHLQQNYDQQQLALGKQAWASPKILPLATYINHLWQDNFASAYLLNSQQCFLLWQRIIKARHPSLLQPQTCAVNAQKAWQLIHQWQLSHAQLQGHANEESSHFLHWMVEFQTRTRQKNWITEAELFNQIITEMQTEKITWLKQIYFIGFDEFTPQEKQFIQLLQQQTNVTIVPAGENKSQVKRLPLADTDDEIWTMARWAKQQWQADTQAQIACIVPNLSVIHAQVRRVFTKVFCPQAQLPSDSPPALPFNISVGKVLQDYKIVRMALLILQWAVDFLTYEQVSQLLQSPYCIAAEAQAQFAAMDVKFRELNQPRISLQQIVRLFEQEQLAEVWLAPWQALLKLQANCQDKLTHRGWADLFWQLLQVSGWPGERSLSSEEYQVVQRWRKLLREFASLNVMGEKIAMAQAYTELQQLTRQTLFQPQSKAASIQILGVLEAGGLSFDQAWLMGLSDQQWPAPAQPNPFIPFVLQNQYHMPHANAARELQYSQVLTNRLLCCANQVIVSYPQQEGDKVLASSALIQELPKITLTDLQLPDFTTYAQQIFNQRQQESLLDNHGPRREVNEHSRGGSDILKQQALCAFRGFAKHRLNAQALNQPQYGLTAKDQGIYLHRCLQLIWQALGSQAQLNTLAEQELQTLLDDTIRRVLRAGSANAAFAKQVEQKRLQLLLYDWLMFEKKRPAFSIQSLEAKLSASIADLDLNLRVDRIDELADGTYLIIDYKSGEIANDYWLGERLTDPQLPLYCLYSPEKATAIAFAQLKNDKLKFKGLSNNATDIDGIAAIEEFQINETSLNWTQLQQHWRQQLTQIAQDFNTGKAKVDPCDEQLTCQYCDLQTLCRIHEHE